MKHINKKISIGCCQTRRASKAGYDICHNDEETGNAKVNDNTNTDDLSEEDFTLRTVESLEVDAMLSKLSPIKGHSEYFSTTNLMQFWVKLKFSFISFPNYLIITLFFYF